MIDFSGTRLGLDPIRTTTTFMTRACVWVHGWCMGGAWVHCVLPVGAWVHCIPSATTRPKYNEIPPLTCYRNLVFQV